MKKWLLSVALLSFSCVNVAYSHLPKAIGSALVTSLAHDAQNLYVGTRFGLTIIDKLSDEQTVIGGNDDEENFIYTMIMQGDTLWMGKKCNTLSYYVKDSIRAFIPLLSSPYFFNELLSDSENVTVTAITFSPATGKQYIGLENFLGEVSETEVKNGIDTGVGYLEGVIQDIEADSSGSIWLCSDCHSYLQFLKYTEENGVEEVLKRFSDSDIPIIKSKNELAGLCMTIDVDDHIWMGIKRGYLIEFDGEAFKTYTLPIAKGDCLYDLMFDTTGVLWMISHHGTLVRYDGKDFEARQLDMLEGEVVYCMDIDGDTIYAGTNKRVIAYSDGTQESIELKIASSVHTVTKSSDAAPARYDLQGRRLSGVPERGVYIEDGRKRVVR